MLRPARVPPDHSHKHPFLSGESHPGGKHGRKLFAEHGRELFALFVVEPAAAGTLKKKLVRLSH